MIAAGHVAEAGLRVLLIEKMKQTGRKLGITGKGRCNLTNTAEADEFIEKVYPDGRFLRSAFSRFYNTELVELINKIGVKTEEERGGRVFPASGKATDIVHALKSWLLSNKVDIQYETRVLRLICQDKEVSGVESIKLSGKKERKRFLSRNVLIATGGLSYPATGSSGDGYKLAKECGHKVTDTFPSLVPLESRYKHIGLLNDLNLRNVKATVYINNEPWKEAFGEIIFRDNSISGPIILTLSRDLIRKINDQNRISLSIDLKPALDEKKLDARLQRDIEQFGKSDIKGLLRKLLPGPLVRICTNKLSLNPHKAASQISAKERTKIIGWLKAFRMDISGYRPYSEAIITSGGIDIKEINQQSFMSKKLEGLYFAGEVLDLDGPTGGYNLQIAFSSGWCAAEAIIKNRDR